MTQTDRPTPDQVAEFVSSLYEDKDQDFDIKFLNLEDLRTLEEEEDQGLAEFIDCLAEAIGSMNSKAETELLVKRLHWRVGSNLHLRNPNMVKGLRFVLLKSLKRIYPDLDI